MTTQMTLEDALKAADSAIARVDEHADLEWKEAAEHAVSVFSRSGQQFTTDDVMDHLDRMCVTTHDNRALGPVMRRAIRTDLVREVGMTRSRRRHGARIPVYQGRAA